MDQNPVMQGSGGDTPNQNNQPANTNANPGAASTDNLSNGNIPGQTANNPAMVTGADGSVVAPATLSKKKHKGLIAVIIIVLVLILGLGGIAAWYLLYYNNPEKVAFDAINGFLQQKTVVSDGIFTGHANTDNGEVLITVDLKNKSTTTSGDGTVTIKASMLDANGELLSDNQYEVELGGIVMSDGVFYFRTGKLMDTLDLFMNDMSVTIDDLDASGQAIYKLLSNVDGEWWQVDVDDVVDNVVEDPALARSTKEFYACLVNVAHSDINGEIASVYSQNRFVNIAPSSDKSKASGVTNYNVNINYDKMASFSNALLESEAAKSAENCIRKYIVDDLGGEANFNHTPAEADKIREGLEGTEFTLGIRDFGHELVSAGVSYKQNDTEFAGNFEFSHPGVTVEAPENYRPISDLVDMLVEAIMEMLGNNNEYDDMDFIYDEETGEWIMIEDDTNEGDNYEEI